MDSHVPVCRTRRAFMSHFGNDRLVVERLAVEIVSVVEIVVIGRAGARALRRRRTLQELRRMTLAARFARLARHPLGRVAADLRLQLDDVEEDVGLAAQFVRHHRRLSGDGGDHRHPDAAPLHRLDERTKVAVAGEQNHVIDGTGDLHGVDRESMSMLPLTLRRPVWSTNSLVALVTTA